MELEFLTQLDEGRALSREGQLYKVSATDVLRLLYLELGAALIFQHESAARQYASKTVGSGPFDKWRMFGTDLYNAATALNVREYREKIGADRGTLNIPLLQRLLRDIGSGKGKASDYAKFTMDAQRSFDISDSLLTGLRRRIADYEHLSMEQRQQLLSDMGRYYAPFGGSGDMKDISKGKSSVGRSFLGWALKMGALAWAGYEIGKRLTK